MEASDVAAKTFSETHIFGLHRFGLGPTPHAAALETGDARESLLSEIVTASPHLRDQNLLSSGEILRSVQEFRKKRKEMNESGRVDAAGPNPTPLIFRREVEARLESVRSANTGLGERLVAFWANHFAVDRRGPLTSALAGAFEREAIRPNILGRFSDMLGAVTRHPAMLFYLNNNISIGPNSKAGIRRDRGLNENHARELLELHTVGVDAGYRQSDVTALALILTGWMVDQNAAKPTFGHFVFGPQRHEPGPQTVMGTTYPQEGVRQGKAVLADLAKNPATHRHIARKFARHFVADDPSPGLVDALALSLEGSGGDLRILTETLVRSDDAWQPLKRLKTPQEFVWSSVRALALPANANIINGSLQMLGHPLWNPPSPEGYADLSSEWLASDAMTRRLDIATDLSSRAAADLDPLQVAAAVLGPAASKDTMAAIAGAGSRGQALALLLMSPEFQKK
jgi:uncharacterized protein (DUF1800 family)